MWYKVIVQSSIDVAIEADSKEEAETKAQEAIWFDECVQDAIKECMEIEYIRTLDDEEDIELCDVKLEE